MKSFGGSEVIACEQPSSRFARKAKILLRSWARLRSFRFLFWDNLWRFEQEYHHSTSWAVYSGELHNIAVPCSSPLCCEWDSRLLRRKLEIMTRHRKATILDIILEHFFIVRRNSTDAVDAELTCLFFEIHCEEKHEERAPNAVCVEQRREIDNFPADSIQWTFLLLHK